MACVQPEIALSSFFCERGTESFQVIAGLTADLAADSWHWP